MTLIMSLSSQNQITLSFDLYFLEAMIVDFVVFELLIAVSLSEGVDWFA